MKNTTKIILLPLVAILAGCGGGQPATITSEGANSRLHRAVQNCDNDGVNYWIRQGANPNMRFIEGGTILRAAIGLNVGRCADVIGSLIRHGADVNVSDNDGSTPLMSAAYHGWHSMIRVLVKAGANVNATDRDGWTALMLAAQQGKQDIVNTLMREGADASITNDYGDTALSIALRNQNTGVVVVFQRHGVSQ